MPTASSSPTASPADYSRHSARPVAARVCAIHQPNFFPRLTTLAKLYRADHWIILDDVQFTRRDYQHRTRLAAYGKPTPTQWLSISVHLPHGRATPIRAVRIADPGKCRQRTRQMIIERYRRSPHWPVLAPTLDDVVSLFDHTDRLADIAEASTLGILRQLGWTGTVSRSSQYATNADRTQRLLDLTASVHATTYLCGRGGIRYLDPTPFTTREINVATLATPATELWTNGYRLSAIDALMASGDCGAVRAIAELPVRPLVCGSSCSP